jgi:uncharacterized membrane protein
VSPRTLELVDLLVRWVHVIAGIMWIGNSLLFNWLDRILEPSRRGGEGMQGETWLIHSGGFYFLEKTQLVGEQLPRPLHWFKWQAYTTWWSGLILLIAVYYVGGRALMVGGAHAELTHVQAAWIGVGAIAGTWILYELIWSFVYPRSRAGAAALSLIGLVVLVCTVTHLLSGRAAFLHVGAALGTLMAWNVVHTIMPSQRVLARAVQEGHGSDPAIADQAKTRSIHNNYLTFPVVILMMTGHFPSVYGQQNNWLLLLVLIAGGAAVRHVMNVRFTYRRWRMALVSVVLASVLALYLLLDATWTRRSGGGDMRASAERAVPEVATFAEARSIIDRRCTVCHSQQPADLSFGPAPGGAAFDTDEQIHSWAPRIRERAVLTRTMPPGNKTRMTDAERAMLGHWLESAGSR